MLRTVSRRVSPFCTALVLAEKLRLSAESLFSAISNEEWVLVEFSKKRLTISFPLRAGTFLIGLSEISFIFSAVSRMCVISAFDRPLIPIRCFPIFILFSCYFFSPLSSISASFWSVSSSISSTLSSLLVLSERPT